LAEHNKPNCSMFQNRRRFRKPIDAISPFT
jgi:hypothetical protein